MNGVGCEFTPSTFDVPCSKFEIGNQLHFSLMMRTRMRRQAVGHLQAMSCH
jgi:hypothetical protein